MHAASREVEPPERNQATRPHSAIAHNDPRRFFAVRRCPMLKGPAIFCCWEDCSPLVNIEDSCLISDGLDRNVDYQEFAALSDAVSFVEDFLGCNSISIFDGSERLAAANIPLAEERLRDFTSVPRKRVRNSSDVAYLVDETARRPKKRSKSSNMALLKSPPLSFASGRTGRPPACGDSVEPQALAASFDGMSVQLSNRNSEKRGKAIDPEKRDKFQISFPQNVKRLEEFRDEYGDCDIPHRRGEYTTADGNSIDMVRFVGMGQWCNQVRNQIKIYQLSPKLSKLSRDQYLKLKGIGFCMHPQRYKEVPLKKRVWDDKKFKELEEFKEIHGHCIVPRDPKTPLRYWLDKVRTAYTDMKEGRPSTLTDEQISRLINLGFVLKSKVSQVSFDDYVNQWKAFKAQNSSGNKDPPSTSALGIWIARMRRKYKDYQKGLKTTISDAQVTRLDEIGFQWKSQHTHLNHQNKKRQPPKTFEQRFAELVEYKQKHGNLYVRKSYPGLGQSIFILTLQVLFVTNLLIEPLYLSYLTGQWVQAARRNTRKHLRGEKTTLTDEKINRLREVRWMQGAYFGFKESLLTFLIYQDRVCLREAAQTATSLCEQ